MWHCLVLTTLLFQQAGPYVAPDQVIPLVSALHTRMPDALGRVIASAGQLPRTSDYVVPLN